MDTLEDFVEFLRVKAREFAVGKVWLRREPLESLLSAVAGHLSEDSEDETLKHAYQVVNDELYGRPGPAGWHGGGS